MKDWRERSKREQRAQSEGAAALYGGAVKAGKEDAARSRGECPYCYTADGQRHVPGCQLGDMASLGQPMRQAEREALGRLMGGRTLDEKISDRRPQSVLQELRTKRMAEGPKPRTQHEAQQQATLSKWAKLQWWGDGYYHHEAATESWLTARRNWQKGAGAGWPDVTVMVPGLMWLREQPGAGGMAEAVSKPATLIALELKRDDDALRPQRRTGHWWLAWARELNADDSWHIKATEPTRHGLSARQALQLLRMHECGWRTMVAYGFDEAKAWLEREIGPRPT